MSPSAFVPARRGRRPANALPAAVVPPPADDDDKPPVKPPLARMEQQQPEDDLSLLWRPHGRWGHGRESQPIAVAAFDAGCSILTLRFRAAPQVKIDIQAIQQREEGEAKQTALATFQGDESWKAYLSARADFEAAKAKAASIETGIAALDAEKRRLQAEPKGKGGRLLANDKERAELAGHLDETKAEAAALEMLYFSAKQEAEEQAGEAAQAALSASSKEHQAALETALEVFADRHKDELTRLLASQVKPYTTFDSAANELVRFLVAALNCEPLPQATPATPSVEPVPTEPVTV